MSAEPRSLCPMHSGLVEKVTNVEKKVESICETDKEQWSAIEKQKDEGNEIILTIQKEKVSMKLFY